MPKRLVNYIWSHAFAFKLGARVPFFCLLSAVLVFLTLTSCANKDEKSPEAKAEKVLTNEWQKQTKSEELANQGETLLKNNLKSAAEAYGKFSEALELDPTNGRAAFWKALLGPTLEFKGLFKRIKPVYTNPAFAGPERYRSFIKSLIVSQESRRYLFDGPEDIETPEELQEWLDRFSNSLDTAKDLLKALRSAETAIRLPPGNFITGTSFGVYNPDCEPISFGPIKYEDPECRNPETRTVNIARADIDQLLNLIGAYQMMFDILTAYRFNLLAMFDNASRSDALKYSDEKTIEILLQAPNAGQLRKNAPFARTRQYSSDYAASLKYLIENQSEVCRNGVETYQNRKGYLIPYGFCLKDLNTDDPHTLRTLNAFETFLAGKPITLNTGKSGDERITFKPNLFVDQPPKHFNEFAPFTYFECGTLSGFNVRALTPYFETEEDLQTFMRNHEFTKCSRRKQP